VWNKEITRRGGLTRTTNRTSCNKSCKVPRALHNITTPKQSGFYLIKVTSNKHFRRFYESDWCSFSRAWALAHVTASGLSWRVDSLTCVNLAGFCLNATQSLSVALSFSTLFRIALGSSFKSLKIRKENVELIYKTSGLLQGIFQKLPDRTSAIMHFLRSPSSDKRNLQKWESFNIFASFIRNFGAASWCCSKTRL